MNHSALIDRLDRSIGVIRELCTGIDAEQAVWRPQEGTWSILEVVAHLLDEEREDFRVRLGLLLRDPDTDWPPIDPEGWALERDYRTRRLDETLMSFFNERQDSLQWLRGLGHPSWNRAKTHPQVGPLSAGDMLASWVAHDWLHIRQIAGLHWEFVQHLAAPYRVEYAGRW